MPIATSIDDQVGLIELGGERPFAIDESFGDELTEAVATLEATGVRSLVLFGSTKVFCAGADLRVAPQAASDSAFRTRWFEKGNAAFLALAECPLPTVAAVNAAAAGAGCNLALCCDHVVAATSARFSQAFIRVGLATDFGSFFLLPRRTGYRAAQELMLSGREVAGEEALTLGLADEIVEREQVLEAALAEARRRGRGPLTAYAAVKRGLAKSAGMGLVDSLELETALQVDVMQHPDFLEGTAAFMEKRPAVFGQSPS